MNYLHLFLTSHFAYFLFLCWYMIMMVFVYWLYYRLCIATCIFALNYILCGHLECSNHSHSHVYWLTSARGGSSGG
jgi:hypothetical protein